MKIAIYYFSGTGNTWYVAKALKAALIEQGAEAKAKNIEDMPASKVTELLSWCDKVIIGYPIYGSDSPRIMREFVANLPKSDNQKPISTFTTVALYSGDGTILYRKLFGEKGYKFETGMEFIMPNNLNVPGFPDVLPIGDEDKVHQKNLRANEKAKKMAGAILTGKTKVQYDRVFGHLMGAVQRKHVDDFIAKLNSTMYVEHDKCIKCMRCVKLCPADNIVFNDGKIEIFDNCMGCMRCYHFCPTGAINITEKSLDAKKWVRYKGPTKDYLKKLLK